jgi:hypothetical protein
MPSALQQKTLTSFSTRCYRENQLELYEALQATENEIRAILQYLYLQALLTLSSRVVLF